MPKLSELVFPDLNGEWRTSVTSNIRTMAEYHPDFSENNLNNVKDKITGKLWISQDWFRIKIRFVSKNDYSSSHTIVVQPHRSIDKDNIGLTYVYENRTIDPLTTDEQFHLGAAALDIIKSKNGFNKLKGSYWTNRNSSKGLNTAGTIIATRIK